MTTTEPDGTSEDVLHWRRCSTARHRESEALALAAVREPAPAAWLVKVARAARGANGCFHWGTAWSAAAIARTTASEKGPVVTQQRDMTRRHGNQVVNVPAGGQTNLRPCRLFRIMLFNEAGASNPRRRGGNSTPLVAVLTLALFSCTLALFGCSSGDSGGGAGNAGSGGQAGGGGSAGVDSGVGGTGGTGGGGVGGTGGVAGQAGSGGVAGQAGSGGDAGQAGSGGIAGQAGSGGVAGQAGSGGSAGASPFCGDDVKNQPNEECDGPDLGGATCASLLGPGWSGTPSCVGCALETTGCSCNPQCSGKQCGPDGCGATCGTCSSGTTCNASGQCVAVCTPNCAGKQCGSDGCSGTCGSCPGGSTCNASGQCVAVCTPNCSGKQCGSDGCSGICGTCPTGYDCNASGQCTLQCTPQCAGKNCGDNGCYDVCGVCSIGETCSGSQCTACTASCPALVSITGGPHDDCAANYDDCTACGPGTCGGLNYAYTCGLTNTSPIGPSGPLTGCQQKGLYTVCCPAPSCVRDSSLDAGCASYGLTKNYSCKAGATVPAGCIKTGYFPQIGGARYCCP